MSRRTRWKDLTIGLAALCAVAGVALAILILCRPGRLRGKTVTVYVTADAARGLIPGSEVWLDGQKVGLVKSVKFRPATVSAKERLVLRLDVLDNARNRLRVDSRVDIRSGTSIIGDQVVYLSSGTARRRGVAEGDTIHGGKQSDIEGMTADMALASREFPGIIENVKLLRDQMQTAEGTLGALGLEKGGPELRLVRAKSSRIMSKWFQPNGTFGHVVNGRGLLQARAKNAMAQVDSIRALLASNQHSLGRFRRDSTLVIEMDRVRNELANVERLADSPTGTIGRMRTDSTIAHNVHQDIAALDSLFADAKKHPFKYIVF
jgi:hypothetical protein